MAGLIAGHELEEAAQFGPSGLKQAAGELLEQQKTGKLGHAGAHQIALVGLFLNGGEDAQPI